MSHERLWWGGHCGLTNSQQKGGAQSILGGLKECEGCLCGWDTAQGRVGRSVVPEEEETKLTGPSWGPWLFP